MPALFSILIIRSLTSDPREPFFFWLMKRSSAVTSFSPPTLPLIFTAPEAGWA